MKHKSLPPYAIWGTGRIGKAFYHRMVQERGIYAPPQFWIDGAKERQGKKLYGIPILAPQDFYAQNARAYIEGKAFGIVIAVAGNNILDVVAEVENNIVRAKKYAALSLYAEDYFAEHADEVQEVRSLFTDEKSRRDYDTIRENLRRGRLIDFSVYSPAQYFIPEIADELSNVSCYIDAGPYDGKEIEYMLHRNPHVVAYAFEPDSASVALLKQKFANENRVHIFHRALWDRDEQLNFTQNISQGSESRLSKITHDVHAQIGGVTSIRLDSIASQIKMGRGRALLKMDIEGAEYNALCGAEDFIRAHRIMLAICVYHSIEDYVRLPLLMKKLRPDAKFYFRHHGLTAAESVVYAI